MKKFNVICICLLLCAATAAAIFFALRSCNGREQTIYVPSLAESSAESSAEPTSETSEEPSEESAAS